MFWDGTRWVAVVLVAHYMATMSVASIAAAVVLLVLPATHSTRVRLQAWGLRLEVSPKPPPTARRRSSRPHTQWAQHRQPAKRIK